MNKPCIPAVLASAVLVLTQLAGCNSKPAPAVEASAGGATARIEAGSNGAVASTGPAQPAPAAASAPDNGAAASIAASGVEARAGDVSVKLPD